MKLGEKALVKPRIMTKKLEPRTISFLPNLESEKASSH